MFDIIFQTTKSCDGTNILLSCFAGNLTIFAFGFPYIYRAISNLSRISIILTNRIKNNGWVKFYPWLLIISFVLNATFLAWYNNTVLCITVLLLLIHIIYVMLLYKIIENSILNPFNNVENKDIHKLDIKFRNEKELENDILLVTDLICYLEKNSFNEPDLQKYFSWLIDVTFFKFQKYDIKNFDYFLGILPKEQASLYSTLHKIYWLNRWAVNERKLVSLDYIDNFYSWVLEYGLKHPKGFNYEAYPTLKTIKNIESLENDYFNEANNVKKDIIKKHCNFIKRTQSEVLEQKKQVSLYRISNDFISNNEIYYFVELLYYILNRKLELKQREKYEPCFSILTSAIDNNIFGKHYPQLFERIKKHHDYFYGKPNIYTDICGFHIIIVSYLIFKNQYQLLKSFLYYEEPPERITQHTRPQIPNTINNILLSYIGSDSVFYNTQTFSANVSSRKYKFYTLFLLLINSKRFAEKCEKNLAKLNPNDWQYEFIKKDFRYHNECSIDFSKINFDDLMSFISIGNYKEYLDNFNKETELLNLFEIKNDDINFIDKILNNIILRIKKAQNNFLRRKFEKIVKCEFSQYKQNELRVKNLYEFINAKIYYIFESVKEIKFLGTNNTNLTNFYLMLYDKTYNKRRILSGQYQYLFNNEPTDDFYRRLFNLLIEHCQKIASVDDIPFNINENYQILSNFDRKQTFVSFGFKKENIKMKPCIVNGEKEDDFDGADVSSIKINNNDIKISNYNNNFHFLNNNKTYPHAIILFDPQRISIELEENRPIKFIDIKGGQVKIQDDTQVKIKIPKDKSLGFYIVSSN